MNNYVKELIEKQLNENYNHLNEDFGKPYQMTDPVSMHDFIEAWEKDGKIDGIKVKPYCHEEMMEEILEDREKHPNAYKEGGWDGTQYYCVFGRWDKENKWVYDKTWDYDDNILGNKVKGSHGTKGIGHAFYYIYRYEHGYLITTGHYPSKKEDLHKPGKGCYYNWLLVMDDHVQSMLDLDITR